MSLTWGAAPRLPGVVVRLAPAVVGVSLCVIAYPQPALLGVGLALLALMVVRQQAFPLWVFIGFLAASRLHQHHASLEWRFLVLLFGLHLVDVLKRIAMVAPLRVWVQLAALRRPPSSTSPRALRETAIALANENWPASSMTNTSIASVKASRDHNHAEPPISRWLPVASATATSSLVAARSNPRSTTVSILVAFLVALAKSFENTTVSATGWLQVACLLLVLRGSQ